jgi:K+-sensing histidine kinase KdpD
MAFIVFLSRAVMLFDGNSWQSDSLVWDKYVQPEAKVREKIRQKAKSRQIKNYKTNAELDFVYSTSHDLRAPLKSMLGLIIVKESEELATQIKLTG